VVPSGLGGVGEVGLGDGVGLSVGDGLGEGDGLVVGLGDGLGDGLGSAGHVMVTVNPPEKTPSGPS
jgi:hypothetical protein